MSGPSIPFLWSMSLLSVPHGFDWFRLSAFLSLSFLLCKVGVEVGPRQGFVDEMSWFRYSSWHRAWPVVVVAEAVAFIISLEGWFLLSKCGSCFGAPPGSWKAAGHLECAVESRHHHCFTGPRSTGHHALRHETPPLPPDLLWAQPRASLHCGFYGWGLWKGGPHALAWSHEKGVPETKKRPETVLRPSGDILWWRNRKHAGHWVGAGCWLGLRIILGSHSPRFWCRKAVVRPWNLELSPITVLLKELCSGPPLHPPLRFYNEIYSPYHVSSLLSSPLSTPQSILHFADLQSKLQTSIHPLIPVYFVN